MSENIKVTVEELRKLISVDNVIGKAIETEDKLLIPVMRMGVGFGVGENILGEDKGGAAGAGAGVEPISMVVVPKKGSDSEGVRVLNLSKGNQTNKAISDLSLLISDLVKNHIKKDDDEIDESEYIEPEFETTEVKAE
ncbi:MULTISPECIES: spore germination protein GerW family protein [Methanobrevibacter]|uniref:GerW family sporulation protein n=2 Tax=Methanobacteriaceae TaxID=2159 RepID=UPI0025E3A66C|nr:MULTISPECIES: spore germination protein GerW family protein [Methanobrevibacter]MBS7257479.1 sporulation protein [Methanobrevibacter sp.]MCI7427771.1 sporulation protein [Methanobrevibacter sp.]